ncbi:phosphohistidine phosphatase [Kytococcus schroeteri]|uniref:Phosphohistidine phosphatase n=1 Tax=Kytococcus schroeteri TaxID=138300 RepID=A0A2I1P893_9MICO|nr:NUDIX domain-containing protein [Kytococcus schroeteri]PKZ40854.1 phosphohistidine phosphatase [Kytococcus schroeteri]
MTRERVVQAAGAVPWRRRRGRLQVAMVHRPHYDDWSWPKGKLDPGELLPWTAAREVAEEASLQLSLGLPLPTARYRMPSGGVKQVHYWAGRVTGDLGDLQHEVDEVAWLSPDQARRRISYPHDREQLDRLLELDDHGMLDTWVLVVLRHALALERRRWDGPDWERPLVPRGFEDAKVLATTLQAFGVDRIVSSPSARCTDTVAPFVALSALKPRLKRGLSEEGFEAEPHKAARHVRKALAKGRSTVLCSHGPVLPSMLEAAAEHTEPGSPEEATVLDLARTGMRKGGMVVLHGTGQGESARVLASETW